MSEQWEEDFYRSAALCRDYTMVSPERMYATWQAARYVASAGIPGAMVECGVWRGGNLLLMASALLQIGISDREIWGYDTFEGMPPPGALDVDINNQTASEALQRQPRTADVANVWCVAPYDGVKRALERIPYPQDRIRLIRGKVEHTIPRSVPRKIALLRLDTDWYESTAHELLYLFPLLEKGGIIIVDDYGHWKGAKQAVDEYFSGNGPRILLNRIDYTGRLGVKI